MAVAALPDSSVSGDSSACPGSPYMSLPGQRSRTLGISVAVASCHTPHKWLLLGPSDTRHRSLFQNISIYWKWQDGADVTLMTVALP